jgi:formylglycine-generating enzyme required for sulfatase activity
LVGLDCQGYRLPTEAEWEYAARAGTQTAFHTGGITDTVCNDPNLDAAGWYCGNSGDRTHRVGEKQANAWGLYDMHGNVFEWVQDWYAEYPAGAAVDPVGPAAGVYRVTRGGPWGSNAQYARAADRNGYSPVNRGNYIGFRPARSL